jgi:phosphatidate cytidylyltransferase
LLRTRVITAVAVLLVLLGMLFFAPAQAWSLFMLAVALLACWEWSRLSGLSIRGQSVYLFFSGALGAAFWVMYERDPGGIFVEAATRAFICSAIFWIAFVPLWLARLARPSAFACAIAGWLVMWPTWFAFVALRDAGPWLLLAVAALVWVADIAAYFTGRAFGRRKLAPAISPGKTWEGVYGGLAGVAAYGALLGWIAHTWPLPISGLFAGTSELAVIGAMLILAALSVMGDLFESWMKRGAGLKDSSGLLPGHGGILDRIDALTSTLPLAAYALTLRAAA